MRAGPSQFCREIPLRNVRAADELYQTVVYQAAGFGNSFVAAFALSIDFSILYEKYFCHFALKYGISGLDWKMFFFFMSEYLYICFDFPIIISSFAAYRPCKH